MDSTRTRPPTGRPTDATARPGIRRLIDEPERLGRSWDATLNDLLED